MRATCLMIVLVVIAAFGLGSLTAAAEVEQPASIDAPLVVVTGNDSRVSTLTYLKINSNEDWKKSWLAHLGMKHDTIHRPAFEVDFRRCLVVAVFGGQTWNTRGYRVKEVEEREESIVVRFENISYQTAGPGGGGDRVTPYAFIVLPKSAKRIVLEDNVQNLIDHPPIWKEVARLSSAGK